MVLDVFARQHDPRTAEKALHDALSLHARAVEAVAIQVAAGSGWTYAGIDPTPAPGGQVSIGAAIEAFTGAPFGSPGPETAAGIITRAVQSVEVKRTGYSGLMLPVLEDAVLDAPLDRGHVRAGFDPRVFCGLRRWRGHRAARRRYQ